MGIKVMAGMTWTKMNRWVCGKKFSTAHLTARRLPLPPTPSPPFTATATEVISGADPPPPGETFIRLVYGGNKKGAELAQIMPSSESTLTCFLLKNLTLPSNCEFLVQAHINLHIYSFAFYLFYIITFNLFNSI